MSQEDVPKKHLIAVSYAFNRRLGSEPGKGYHWTVALSRLYHVHLIHSPECAFEPDDSNLNSITRYPINAGVSSWARVDAYWHYEKWCRIVIQRCREVMAKFPIVGLHHATLGSFRFLPRYDQLGLPYSLGPLGGGESIPLSLLLDCGFPFKEKVAEAFRPLINRACVLRSGVRSVLRCARRVIATTEESAELLRSAGAADVIVRFPDVFENCDDMERVSRIRAEQCSELSKEIRLVWSGRGLWWKGGQIALRFLQRLYQEGISAHLDIYSAGPCIEPLRRQVRSEGMDGVVTFHEPVARQELLKIYEQKHLFVYPTLHDSSSSAIPEAYSTGLPSMTLGIGGAAVASDPGAGLNQYCSRLDEWLSAGVDMVKSWRRDPRLWLNASQSALQKSTKFGFAQLIQTVADDQPAY